MKHGNYKVIVSGSSNKDDNRSYSFHSLKEASEKARAILTRMKSEIQDEDGNILGGKEPGAKKLWWKV